MEHKLFLIKIYFFNFCNKIKNNKIINHITKERKFDKIKKEKNKTKIRVMKKYIKTFIKIKENQLL